MENKKAIKQQKLIKKQPPKKAAKKQDDPLVDRIKNTLNSQHRKVVHYRDEKGNKQSRTITLNDAGIDDQIKIEDFVRESGDTSNYVGLFSMLMNDVIADPKMSYAKEAKKLPKSLKTKTVQAKNNSKQSVNLNFKWPGYEDAVIIATEMQRPDGGSNMMGAWQDLKDYVIKDDDGKSVSSSYFNVGGHCSGLGIKALYDAINYLNDVLNYDGFLQCLRAALSFLSTSVQQ